MEAESICCAVIFLFFSLKNRYMYSRRRNTRDFQLPVNYIKKTHIFKINLSSETQLIHEHTEKEENGVNLQWKYMVIRSSKFSSGQRSSILRN